MKGEAFKWKEGLCFLRSQDQVWKLCVPNDDVLRAEILSCAHDSSTAAPRPIPKATPVILDESTGEEMYIVEKLLQSTSSIGSAWSSGMDSPKAKPVEKEAYSVVESCKRLNYLLVRPDGFRLLTNHRNIVYMFKPSRSNSKIANLERRLALYMDPDDRIWVPDSAVDLQQRLCVITHQGASGHRRIAATTKSVAANFIWRTLKDDVEKFVRGCLLLVC
ncbi:hypothetical protein H257_19092 [Aphanomyces astaci]|uniref:Integrase zinc-binding domain-containing protein n=1 Tax=Aphanomyces astaci TaxID=112090 RepID=W4F943_APHAT|nr:hypothetical protein H257_19092 [Aphanomyces astaci]ETV63972.1 hypothetical protein H257_19092 [Aphanomyces astaci]|eukprot:XP_009846544.1 hypothetical protein H257_19092 [Aphanomyces astaci]